MNEQELMNVAEAGTYLRLRPSTIRSWILRRRLAFVKLGGKVFLRRSDLDHLIAQSLVPATAGRTGSIQQAHA